MTRRARLGGSRSVTAVVTTIFGVLLAAPYGIAAEPEKAPAKPPAAEKDKADDKGGSDSGKAPGAVRRPDPGGRSAPVATPPAAAGPSVDAPAAASGDEQYDIKVRQLEEKVTGLKERIFRTKTRLLLLREQVLNDVIAEAKAVIVHVNEMGADFKLEQVFYQLDGEKIFYQDNADGRLNAAEKIEIYSGNLLPGNHVLSVEMRYRGDSSVFGYLNDYVFRLRANFTFYATKGKITTVRSFGFLRGDVTYDLLQRPYIKFKSSQESYSRGTEEKASEGAAK